MKNQAFNRRKFRYASTSAILTALIIAAIIIFNVIFSALGTRFLWYLDLTPELLFTLSDEAYDLIENGDEQFKNSSSPIEMVDKFRAENKKYNADNGLKEGDAGYRDENVMIEIIFCDDIDVLEENLIQKYVYHTALELQDKFSEYIVVKNYDIIRNPSAVSQFKETSLELIDPTNVIVTCGTEYRKYNLRSFYTFESTDSESPWAYNAEKKFAAGILAVTRAETPVACLTNNHGENLTSTELIYTLEDAGYEVVELDLSKDEIPENCRLIVVCDPQADFLVADGISEVDEIGKLDTFIDNTNSMMVFMSPDTPELVNFEEYLDEWGIVFDRQVDNVTGQVYPKLISDKSQSIRNDADSTDGGYTFISEYVTEGVGASFTAEMRSRNTPKKVIFSNAMPIKYSSRYSLTNYTDPEDETVNYNYASYSADGINRSIFDIFVTSENAIAYANGVESGKATAATPLKLMTVTVEERDTQESNDTVISEASYVLACASTEFLDEKLLQSESYGNQDLLLSVCRTIGQEPVPVGLSPKPFSDTTIDVITTAEATQYTVVLTVVPAIVAITVGTVVIVRRKNR